MGSTAGLLKNLHFALKMPQLVNKLYINGVVHNYFGP
jgi:hypothetical protein